MTVDQISNNPMDRVPEPLKKRLHDNPEIGFDIHFHIFNYEDVPDGFLGIRFPFTRKFLKKLVHFLHDIIPWTDTDPLDNIAYFIDIFRTKTSEQIMEKTFGYYDYDHYTGKENTVFCPLMMDMWPGIKGKQKLDYQTQIENMKTIRDRYPNRILPFVAVDPNRDDVFEEVFLKAFSPDYNFYGVKIYPSLGYLPSHPKLMDIFAICEEKNIPVTAHCLGGIVHNSKHHIKGINGLKKINGEYREITENRWFFVPDQYAHYFNNPKNWEPVLHSFTKLRLNLAHFGIRGPWLNLVIGKNDTWFSRIMTLMEKYENVYADISFNIAEPLIFNFLRGKIERNQLIRERLLYGSDYYMVVVEGHFRAMKINFETAMGDEIMKQIACANPKRFLGLDEVHN